MTSAFRDAVEARDVQALRAVLHPDVVFHSPAVFKPYLGRDATMTLLRAVIEVFDEFRYVGQTGGDDEQVLRFTARVGDRDVEGVDVIRYDADGLVVDLTVLIRPLSALVALAEAMQAKLAEQATPR